MKSLIADTAVELEATGTPERAFQMAAYMRDQFEFYGVASPVRKKIQKPVMAAVRSCDAEQVLEATEYCWSFDQREMQYVGMELLRKAAKVLRPGDLDRVRALLIDKSWWDTVDGLAAHVVGTMVAAYPQLGAVMDRWIAHDNIWIARTALLHQLTYKDQVDDERLFDYVLSRASDTEFFIRKAAGWALRSYAKVAPHDVAAFVHQHDNELSGLTKREATKHL